MNDVRRAVGIRIAESPFRDFTSAMRSDAANVGTMREVLDLDQRRRVVRHQFRSSSAPPMTPRRLACFAPSTVASSRRLSNAGDPVSAVARRVGDWSLAGNGPRRRDKERPRRTRSVTDAIVDQCADALRVKTSPKLALPSRTSSPTPRHGGSREPRRDHA